MLWLAVMALPGGGRVESSLPTAEDTFGDVAGAAFRVYGPDGSLDEFSNLTAVLGHLCSNYELGHLGRGGDVLHPFDLVSDLACPDAAGRADDQTEKLIHLAELG